MSIWRIIYDTSNSNKIVAVTGELGGGSVTELDVNQSYLEVSENPTSTILNEFLVFLKKVNVAEDDVEDRAQNDIDSDIELVKWFMLRTARDNKLLNYIDIPKKYMDWAGDWTEQQITDWKDYRQALLDVPGNESDILNVDLDNYVWPTIPSTPIIPGVND